MRALLVLACVFSLVAALNYKVSVDIESIKSKQPLAATFHPNALEEPVSVDDKSTGGATVKVKLQDKETLDVMSAKQVVLTLKNRAYRKSFVLAKKGPFYTFELIPKLLPAQTLQASIVVVDDDLESLDYPFGSVSVSNDNAVVDDDYHPKPEISHVFRKDEPERQPFLPNLFTALTLSPWVILLGSWVAIGANINNYVTSSSNLIFGTAYFCLLAASLMLFHAFWIKLNLFQLFGYGLPCWTATALIGRAALMGRAMQRAAKIAKGGDL
ncbi:proteasome regulatory particle base subunit [Kappamyces sp. JEL0680]|nr:proteasome regulatory particle base subunit [Kappamyces sp. JEL0680]